MEMTLPITGEKHQIVLGIIRTLDRWTSLLIGFQEKHLAPLYGFCFPPLSLSCVIVIGKQVMAKDSIPCKFVIIFKRRDYFYFLEHMNYICRKTIDIVITFTHTHLQETGRRRQTGWWWNLIISHFLDWICFCSLLKNW